MSLVEGSVHESQLNAWRAARARIEAAGAAFNARSKPAPIVTVEPPLPEPAPVALPVAEVTPWVPKPVFDLPENVEPYFSRRTYPTIDDVITCTSAFYGMPRVDMVSQRKTKQICFVRHVAMLLAREMTLLSTTQIGYALGGRDHTTVIHGCQKIALMAREDQKVGAEIDAIRRSVRELLARRNAGASA